MDHAKRMVIAISSEYCIDIFQLFVSLHCCKLRDWLLLEVFFVVGSCIRLNVV